MSRVLCINPGSTSTKIAFFDDDTELYAATVHHSPEELAAFPRVSDQAGFRTRLVIGMLGGAGVATEGLDAVVGRGGLSPPQSSGTYRVDERLLADVAEGARGEHASNLGAIVAARIAAFCRVPAYVVDPVMVDELEDLARYSGHPEIERRSIFHALNHKAVARRHARTVGQPYPALNLVVAHLGGGISVAAHRAGRVVDVNNALNGDGPFAPERAGGLPTSSFVRFCLEGGRTHAQVRRLLAGAGGYVSLLGTNDGRAVAARAASGEGRAALVQDALAYQVAKEVGRCAAVLHGAVDAVLLTGGLSRNEALVAAIRAWVAWIAPVAVYEGEDEMTALAEGALRVLHGDEEAKTYA